MDYEKLYKEALERAKDYKNGIIHTELKIADNLMDYIFPELKESEEEKIRKEILFIVKEKKEETGDRPGVLGMSYDDMIAWLEKQGEKTVIGNGSNSASVSDGDNSVTSKEVVSQPTMLSKDEQYTLARIIESLEDDECPTEWLTLLNDIYSMSCQKSTEWSEEDERIRQCLIRDQEKALDDVRNDKYGHSEIISDLKEMYRERIGWLKSLKERLKGE